MKTITSKTFKTLGTIAASAWLVSCTGGGGGITVTGIGSSSDSSSLAITNIYPSSEASTFSTPSASNRYHVRGLSASILGTCSRGIATIRVNEGAGDYTETATCLNNGTFVWNKTYVTGAQGNKTLNLTAYDVTDTIVSGVTASIDVRIDDTAPAAPTLVSPATTPHTHSGSTGAFTYQFTGAGDVVSMTGPASAALTFNSPNYEYSTTLADGATTTSTFYAYDLAGNQSTGTSVQVSYSPSVSLIIGSMAPGGSSTDGGTNYGLLSNVFSVSDLNTDAGTSYVLRTGFNHIVEEVR